MSINPALQALPGFSVITRWSQVIANYNAEKKLNELYANPNMHDFAIFCLWFTMFGTPTIVSTSLLVMGVDPAVNFAVTSSFVFVPLFCITAIDLAYKCMRIRNE